MHTAKDTFFLVVLDCCLLLLDRSMTRIVNKVETRIGIFNWSRTWIRTRAGIRVALAGVRFPQLTE